MKNHLNKPDYKCQFDDCTVEGSWGFHGKFFCTAHKQQGEAFMNAISEGASSQFQSPNAEIPVAPKQGKLL